MAKQFCEVEASSLAGMAVFFGKSLVQAKRVMLLFLSLLSLPHLLATTFLVFFLKFPRNGFIMILSNYTAEQLQQI